MEDTSYEYIPENIAYVFAHDNIDLLSMDAHDFIKMHMGFRNQGGYDTLVTRYKGATKAFALGILCTEHTESLDMTDQMLRLRTEGVDDDAMTKLDKIILRCGMRMRKAALMYIKIEEPAREVPAK